MLNKMSDMKISGKLDTLVAIGKQFGKWKLLVFIASDEFMLGSDEFISPIIVSDASD